MHNVHGYHIPPVIVLEAYATCSQVFRLYKITSRLQFQFLRDFRQLDLSELAAKHQSRLTRYIAEMPGLWAGTGMELGRFRDVQSSINWVKIEAVGLYWTMAQLGWSVATTFIGSGRSLLLISMVALQATRTLQADHRVSKID